MKVRANNDIFDNGRLYFLKNEIYMVKVELSELYLVYSMSGKLRCMPKKFFTVVLEEGVK